MSCPVPAHHRSPRSTAAEWPLQIAGMGTLRKLQTEIDKTLKKVAEGLSIFDDIWEQVPQLTMERACGRGVCCKDPQDESGFQNK